MAITKTSDLRAHEVAHCFVGGDEAEADRWAASHYPDIWAADTLPSAREA